MKLPIKEKYWNQIVAGEKDFEVRDAHITFVSVETGKELGTVDIESATISRGFKELYPDVLEDDFSLFMKLKKVHACPVCKSGNVVSCKGSTSLKPIPSIDWICVRCLYEW